MQDLLAAAAADQGYNLCRDSSVREMAFASGGDVALIGKVAGAVILVAY